ncbi:MAG: substrate-binding periplasmic protein [Actinomycetota bacterium]
MGRGLLWGMGAVLGVLITGTAWARDLRFVTVEAAPWAAHDTAVGRDVGVFPEVVAELKRRLGVSITVALHPFARIDHDLQSGEQDCTIIVWSDTRAGFVERGAALFPHTLGVLARKGVRLADYGDLRPLRLSVLRGLPLGQPFDGDEAISKDYDTDYLQALRKVVHGRVDAVVGALPTLRYLADRDRIAGLFGDQLVLARPELTLQCSKNSANLDLMPSLNRAIGEMREDGTLDRIRAAHYY